jgi:hypothetical protein
MDSAQVDELVERLRSEGAPQGIWLIEIAQAREALQQADALLRRMSSAIVEGMPTHATV